MQLMELGHKLLLKSCLIIIIGDLIGVIGHVPEVTQIPELSLLWSSIIMIMCIMVLKDTIDVLYSAFSKHPIWLIHILACSLHCKRQQAKRCRRHCWGIEILHRWKYLDREKAGSLQQWRKQPLLQQHCQVFPDTVAFPRKKHFRCFPSDLLCGQ